MVHLRGGRPIFLNLRFLPTPQIQVSEERNSSLKLAVLPVHGCNPRRRWIGSIPSKRGWRGLVLVADVVVTR